jgi:uncharacterized protein YfaS (alpha-2-macroglobulin family)
LQPLSDSLSVGVGDVVVCRLRITADRAMDFVRLCDYRPACLEPIDALSGFRWRDRLSYYQSINDTSVDCFIDYLPKGVSEVECRYRVARSGDYATGSATVESTYAPEFRAMSASQTVHVE